MVFFSGGSHALAAKLALAAFCVFLAGQLPTIFIPYESRWPLFGTYFILPDKINITIKSPEDSDASPESDPDA